MAKANLAVWRCLGTRARSVAWCYSGARASSAAWHSSGVRRSLSTWPNSASGPSSVIGCRPCQLSSDVETVQAWWWHGRQLSNDKNPHNNFQLFCLRYSLENFKNLIKRLLTWNCEYVGGFDSHSSKFSNEYAAGIELFEEIYNVGYEGNIDEYFFEKKAINFLNFFLFFGF